MNTYIKSIEGILQQKFNVNLADIAQKINTSNSSILLAQNSADVSEILKLRQQTYPYLLPEVTSSSLEPIDYHSLLFFSEDTDGNIESTCRLVIGDIDFAENYVYQPYLKDLKQRGDNFAEWGRCIVCKHSVVRALDYTTVLKAVALDLQIDHICIFNRACDVQRVLDKVKTAQILCETDITLGGSHQFTAILWSLAAEKATRTPSKNIYNKSIWHDYAKSFSTITTSYQSQVLKESANYLSGNVIDCGAGCAKIAPFLVHRDCIEGYTGVDACKQMCALGNQVIHQLNREDFAMVESYIESFKLDKTYDSAVSINSFYTWSDPLLVLNRIYSLLKVEGIFVLASINDNIDMLKLAQNVTPDLIAHPDFATFKRINLDIQKNQQAHLLSLDGLIKLVHKSGFKVIKCHDDFYEKGLNFMVLSK